jgi:20S proteasome alpha/beta subunit
VTSIVGVLCQDGAVIGTDSSATLGTSSYRTIEQPTGKITILHDRYIVAGTGEVGLGQRFCDDVASIGEAAFSKSPIDTGRNLCAKAIQDFGSTGLTTVGYGALVAFSCQRKAYITEFAHGNFQPELLERDRIWYSSMGSAKIITDPFLGFFRRALWDNRPPTVADAVRAVHWALELAIELNTGGVNGPIQLAVLENTPNHGYKARMVEELEEHAQFSRGAIDALRTYQASFRERGAMPAPEPPPEAPKGA